MNENLFNTNRKTGLAFLSLALLMGIVLRLSFPNDVEYKGDEKYMFEAAQTTANMASWPPLGMASGVGLKNPGMSVWIFIVLSRLFHASTPPELSQTVQYLNILGLLVLAFFSFRLLPEGERTPWLWATAFAAVNPFAVLWSRKIWAQDTMSLFCVLLWMAWHYRQKRAGAFFWGLLGICLGQIHMSGFFLAGGIFLWTITHDRRVKWGSWLTGSVVGAIPLIPWLEYVVSNPGGPFDLSRLLWILYPRYWFFWLSNTLGIGLNYSLKTRHFMDLMSYPLVGGAGTYLVGIAHVVILVTAVLIILSVRKNGGFLRDFQDTSETGLAINSVFIASGLLLTLACVAVYRHYLIMSFPLEWVWLSRLGLRDERQGQKYLMAIWIAQLIISTSFLIYIHVNHGDPLGDYGVAYQFQPK